MLRGANFHLHFIAPVAAVLLFGCPVDKEIDDKRDDVAVDEPTAPIVAQPTMARVTADSFPFQPTIMDRMSGMTPGAECVIDVAAKGTLSWSEAAMVSPSDRRGTLSFTCDRDVGVVRQMLQGDGSGGGGAIFASGTPVHSTVTLKNSGLLLEINGARLALDGAARTGPVTIGQPLSLPKAVLVPARDGEVVDGETRRFREGIEIDFVSPEVFAPSR